jgi:hypothetical protein
MASTSSQRWRRFGRDGGQTRSCIFYAWTLWDRRSGELAAKRFKLGERPPLAAVLNRSGVNNSLLTLMDGASFAREAGAVAQTQPETAGGVTGLRCSDSGAARGPGAKSSLSNVEKSLCLCRPPTLLLRLLLLGWRPLDRTPRRLRLSNRVCQISLKRRPGLGLPAVDNAEGERACGDCGATDSSAS